jgi:hypothetical protein
MDWVQGLLLGMIIGLIVCRFVWIWDDIRKKKDHDNLLKDTLNQ